MLLTGSAFAHEKDGHVSFKAPKNGAVVTKTFKVKFGLHGKRLRKAGDDITDKKSGHHHLIIDGAFVPEGQVVPTDETHKHFGKAQTQGEITLTPGKHTLTLQLADGAHISYGKKYSTTIEVTVE